MTLKKLAAALAAVLITTLGGIGLAQTQASAVPPGSVVETVDPGDGDNGIWP